MTGKIYLTSDDWKDWENNGVTRSFISKLKERRSIIIEDMCDITDDDLYQYKWLQGRKNMIDDILIMIQEFITIEENK